jgi:hypothetical protein
MLCMDSHGGPVDFLVFFSYGASVLSIASHKENVMTIPQLYVPAAGAPIFAAGTRVLVAGYSSVGGSWNPTICSAGSFREPWLPQQVPIFTKDRSTIESIPRLPDDIVRAVTLSPGTPLARTVAAVIRTGRKKDEFGMRMYVLSEDVERQGDTLITFIERHRDNPLLSMARYSHEYAVLAMQICETMCEVRRQVGIRFPGFIF